MIKIVIFDGAPSVDEKSIEVIRQTAAGLNVVAPPRERLADELADAEIFYGYHTPEIFREAKRLRWIQSTAAGMDAIIDSQLAARDLMITNASGVHGPQVAEAAWALTLAVARRLPVYFRQQREHVWQCAAHLDLDGAMAGVVGLGGVGRRYARIAAAMGMRVIAVDRHHPSKPDSVQAVWHLDRLAELLGIADVVLISCPYTADTHHLIDAPGLARMKPNAILVNIARGGIVDEVALLEALRAGRIAGAGIDVCETEPLPSDSPLWDAPNLVITPHCAGYSPQRSRRLTAFFCENLQRYLAHERLLNLVDPHLGYPVPEPDLLQEGEAPAEP